MISQSEGRGPLLFKSLLQIIFSAVICFVCVILFLIESFAAENPSYYFTGTYDQNNGRLMVKIEISHPEIKISGGNFILSYDTSKLIPLSRTVQASSIAYTTMQTGAGGFTSATDVQLIFAGDPAGTYCNIEKGIAWANWIKLGGFSVTSADNRNTIAYIYFTLKPNKTIGDLDSNSIKLETNTTELSNAGLGNNSVLLLGGENSSSEFSPENSNIGVIFNYPGFQTVLSGGDSTADVTPDIEEEIIPEITKFSDVSGWAEEYIDYLVEKGIIKGKTETEFAPKDSITRAEFIMILARMSGVDLNDFALYSFSDVEEGAWFSNAVTWAKSSGIALGDNGKFYPEALISRQDMAVMLVRYAEKIAGFSLPETQQTVTFSDNMHISEYAQQSVTIMQKAGIISGTEENSFNPQFSATREVTAKMAAMLHQMIY